ncbi:acyl-CoA dehydrogenase family protein [Actinomadura sp. 7K507]|uniref:acyl-CoA dehydrogenase family protein n=1 Tax=Actinomadura sp. 7K507 TaxID=2530365 RepID=UPI0010511613|nr:acyl-CoA dehydrogenase family protein [Actinomadura sp. 7K507]TDC97610.1 acyl-CoA dehydrogenase [Actinomadura sp. 7K507]
MRFGPGEDQLALRDAVRGLLSEYPRAARGAYEGDHGDGRRLWDRMVRELELTAVGVPEEYGGTGATFTDVAVVAEELGRALAPVPFFSSAVLATRILLESGDAGAWLPAMVRGESIATAALVEGTGEWSFATLATTARRVDDGWSLAGAKHFVTDAPAADLFLVLAQAPEGPTLFAVRAGDVTEHVPQDAVDATRPLGLVVLRGSPGEPVGPLGGALAVLDRALRAAAIALACEQAGGASRCLDMAAGYARVREQFDRPIGSFQAVKHMLADVLVDNESASAAASYAAWAVDNAPDEVPALASLCKAFASDAYTAAAKTNVQVHGGIGFTWEHDAHLHLRRAVSGGAFLGSPGTHRKLMAAAVLDAPRGERG